jgi:UDP-GlcNAc:undecaprenyl-phosphate GlcNAc-1-phosphate transferase
MAQDLIAAPLLAFMLAAGGIALLRRTSAFLPQAIPNARSLHARPIPRVGGYAIWLGFLPPALLYAPRIPGGVAGWLPPLIALVVVSGIDDAREAGVAPRLSVHGLSALWAAAWLVLPGAAASGTALAVTLSTVAGVALIVAWSSNLYNFMDGTDGLAGTMGAIGFAAYGAAAVTAPANADAARSAPAFLALSAAILPFLAVNRPRATMFLGDVGAVPLGYLAAVFGAAGVLGHWWAAWFPLLVFLPFIADATLTLARRIARRERLWEGHRGHYYQRLAQLGAGHRGTLAVYSTLMAVTALTAIVCHAASAAAGWWALGLACAVVFMLFAAIDYHWRKKTGIPSPR